MGSKYIGVVDINAVARKEVPMEERGMKEKR